MAKGTMLDRVLNDDKIAELKIIKRANDFGRTNAAIERRGGWLGIRRLQFLECAARLRADELAYLFPDCHDCRAPLLRFGAGALAWIGRLRWLRRLDHDADDAAIVRDDWATTVAWSRDCRVKEGFSAARDYAGSLGVAVTHGWRSTSGFTTSPR